ncbi:hypothetical protein [Bacillus sp. FJAT-49736]|uniref:hypothetical protein n=1 Tax=Bacillus sp. FJAT-49736 TaxID=2833582 RepID=UPI001BC9F14F|nr:hypothetical protein [Bacillus sp. FJAT-49736]MBS4173492.1 hypothetical protein [Bacillus sp. FJAT-49736]
MKISQKRYGAEDIRFASNTSHIDNTVHEWKMSPEELAKHNSKIGGDKMNGLTKEKYVELKKVEKLKDIEIANVYNMTPSKLWMWKNKTFITDELKDLNLPRGNATKTIQTEEKPQETENTVSQDDVKAEYEKTIQQLKDKLIANRNRYELEIKELTEKWELEKEAREQMAKSHKINRESLEKDTILAQERAKEEHKQYLDTLDKLKISDYELEDAKQRIKELESERDQYKLSFEQATALLNPLRQLVKVAL